MDPFYAFLIFAALLVLERMAASTWLAVYYRFGIPVMVIHRRLEAGERLDLETFEPKALAKALNGLFRARPDHPSIQFKALAAERKSRAEVAFHESLFETRAGFRYLPVTHALARLRLDEGVVSVTGYLDWYALFVLVYVVLATLQDRSFIFIAIIVVILFGVSYQFQKAVNGLVAERIESILMDESIQETQPRGTDS